VKTSKFGTYRLLSKSPQLHKVCHVHVWNQILISWVHHKLLMAVYHGLEVIIILELN